METSKTDFIPILLGSDFNAYGMARSFYKMTGKKVKAFAEMQLAPTRFTKIVDLELIPGFSEDPDFFEAMKKIAKHY